MVLTPWNATIWQDLDNDGVKDAGEPETTSNLEGKFSLSITKSDTDAPILASGGTDMGSGLANNSFLKINSNLKLTLEEIGVNIPRTCLDNKL